MSEHKHGHSHRHHHAEFSVETGKRFIAAIVLNIIFVAAEFFFGFKYHSAGLMADAGHNLGDTGGLVISLAAFLLLKKKPDMRFTFGLKKATVLAAFINSLILIGAVVMIIIECIHKFHGTEIASGKAVMLTAAAGIAVNGFTVWLLSCNKEKDLNVKGAYLHMLADTLVSCGVVVSGGLMMLTDWKWLDPVVGLVIAAIIIRTSQGLFKESLILILDGVPHDINLEHLQAELSENENVAKLENVHLFAVSTTENAFSANVTLHDISKASRTAADLKKILHNHNISNIAIDFF